MTIAATMSSTVTAAAVIWAPSACQTLGGGGSKAFGGRFACPHAGHRPARVTVCRPQ
jgi:hypothetical protein